MATVTIRELNANVSRVITRVQHGETVDVSKDGKVVAEIRPKGGDWLDDPVRREARETLLTLMDKRIFGMSGPLSYDERTDR